jgi:transposase-like protein
MQVVRNPDLARVAQEVARVRSGGKHRRLPNELRQQVMDLVTSGLGIARVSKACGLQQSVLYRWRQEMRRSFRSSELTPKRLAVVAEGCLLPVPPNPPFVARFVVNDVTVEIETCNLRALVMSLRSAP